MHYKEYKKGDVTLQVTIVLKKRKTIGIYVDTYGNVEIRGPINTPEAKIDEIVEAKWPWIIKHVAEHKEKTKGFKEKTYEDGEHFLFLGKEYPIAITEDETLREETIEFDGLALLIRVKNRQSDKLQKLMSRFYKQQCKRQVESRIKYFQHFFKEKPKAIKISSNKKIWGSCNSNRELTFNWKLMMAPPEVIDYIVVHEMCHMVHMNHDRSFWRLVGKLMPEYKICEDWLLQSHWKMTI